VTHTAVASTVLSVSVRLERDGPVVAEEIVTDQDLDEVVSEAWMSGHLRSGRLESHPKSLERRVRPDVVVGRAGVSTYTVETTDGEGATAASTFSLRSLEHVAARAADRLIDAGVLKVGGVYYYDLLSSPPRSDGRAALPGPSFTVEAVPRPLACRSLRLDPLLEIASPVGPDEADAFPVFFTEKARRKAELYSRRGGARTPPEESGGVLLGPLCSCPDTGELFVVVCEVLEAVDAEHGKYSLEYSGRTWTRIQTIVAAIQRQPAMREFRIVGQCHGHNFLPADGAEPCDACASAPVCGRTSVFVSSDDLTWSRAVFAHQPWKLCQIFGWNARREPVEGLFGLKDGRLLERGYHLIPDFDPTRTD